MKANEVKSKFVYPDKLYARCKNNKTLDISYAPQTLEAVEYTRNDAFIKKACAYIKEHLFDYWSQSVTNESKFIEDFRKYMEE